MGRVELRVTSMPHTPVSRSADVVWPAIPQDTGTLVLSLVQQLEHSEWWPAEKLLEAQFGQLAKVVEHARETVAFYRDRLAAFDFSGNPVALRERWRRRS